MKIYASVLLSSGLELLGTLEDYSTRPQFSEDGVQMFANDDEGKLIEIDRFWLYGVLRSHVLATAHGIANVLQPCMQTAPETLDTSVVLVRRDDIIRIAEPKPDLVAQYEAAMQKVTTGLELPPNAGKFSLVKP